MVRSLALQAGLKTKREQARQRLYAELTQPAKQGRKRYHHQEELAQEVTTLLNRYHLNGIVTVTLRAEPYKDGGQRWLVAGYQCDEAAWQQMVDQLGWQVYLSNAPTCLYADPDLVLTYRRQPRLEQDIARLKSRNLHIRPVFLHDEQRIAGLTWLLFLALRLILLLEFRLRRQLAQRNEAITGLNPAAKNQTTNRLTVIADEQNSGKPH